MMSGAPEGLARLAFSAPLVTSVVLLLKEQDRTLFLCCDLQQLSLMLCLSIHRRKSPGY
jgi:hypothetical protein